LGELATVTVPLDTVDRLCEKLEISQLISFISRSTSRATSYTFVGGMERVMEASSGVAVAVEYNPSALRNYGEEPEGLLEFFDRRGYDAWMLERSCFLSKAGTGEIARALRRLGYTNLLFTRKA
jgi:hypothetical protein